MITPEILKRAADALDNQQRYITGRQEVIYWFSDGRFILLYEKGRYSKRLGRVARRVEAALWHDTSLDEMKHIFEIKEYEADDFSVYQGWMPGCPIENTVAAAKCWEFLPLALQWMEEYDTLTLGCR